MRRAPLAIAALITGLTALSLVAACSDAMTAPDALTARTRDPHCMYSGDTIGQVKLSNAATGAVLSCFWVVADHDDCSFLEGFHPASERSIPPCPPPQPT